MELGSAELAGPTAIAPLINQAFLNEASFKAAQGITVEEVEMVDEPVD